MPSSVNNFIPPLHPDCSKTNEKSFKKTAVGKETLKFVEKTYQALGYKKISKFFKDMKKEHKKGTCAGQSCSVIIAHEKNPKMSEKKVLKSVHSTDVMALQSLEVLVPMKYLDTTTKNIKKLSHKLHKKKETVKKNLHNFSAIGKEAQKLLNNLVKKEAGYEQLKMKKFHKETSFKENFHHLINKHASKNQKVAIEMKFFGKKMGHAIAILLGKHYKIYDSNVGFIKCKHQATLEKTMNLLSKTYKTAIGTKSVEVDIYSKKK